MADNQDRRPPGAPPREFLAQAHDVGARGDDWRTSEMEAVQPTRINDVQPLVEADGTLTLVACHRSPRFGVTEAVAWNMPMGVFLELIQVGPQMAGGAAEMAHHTANTLRRVAEASGQEVKRWDDYEAPPRAGVQSLEDRRG